jgi:hypothetical protein
VLRTRSAPGRRYLEPSLEGTAEASTGAPCPWRCGASAPRECALAGCTPPRALAVELVLVLRHDGVTIVSGKLQLPMLVEDRRPVVDVATVPKWGGTLCHRRRVGWTCTSHIQRCLTVLGRYIDASRKAHIKRREVQDHASSTVRLEGRSCSPPLQ